MTATQRADVKSQMRHILRSMTNGQLANLARDSKSPSGRMAKRMLLARLADPH